MSSGSEMLRLALLLGAAASCLAAGLQPELDMLRFNQIQGDPHLNTRTPVTHFLPTPSKSARYVKSNRYVSIHSTRKVPQARTAPTVLIHVVKVTPL